MWALITGKEKDVKHSTSLPLQNSLFLGTGHIHTHFYFQCVKEQ